MGKQIGEGAAKFAVFFAAEKGGGFLHGKALLHQGDHVVSIPGTTKQTRFDENQAANDVTLGAAELAFLDEHLAVGAAAGARY